MANIGNQWRNRARLTKIAEDGRRTPKNDKDRRSLPKLTKVFDGKMCDVGYITGPSGLQALILTRLRLDGNRELSYGTAEPLNATICGG